MNKKINGLTALGFVFVFIAQNVMAGEFAGKIVDVASGTHLNDSVIIATETAVTNRASCVTNSYWDFSINNSRVRLD